MSTNFQLPFMPERSIKNRESGITMMMDKGLSFREVEDLIDSCGDYVDLAKLGFGTSYLTKKLKEKIKLYQEANIKVYLGGTLLEAYYVRGLMDEYRRLLDDLGLNLAEVSDGCIDMPHDDKCELITSLSKEVTVISEVGSKEADVKYTTEVWISKMQDELAAGSWKVIAEARESGNVGVFDPSGKANKGMIDEMLLSIDGKDIIWETPHKAQQVWFVKKLGSNVNLGNIASNEIIPLETLRIGLRGDTFSTFLPEQLKQKYQHQH